MRLELTWLSTVAVMSFRFAIASDLHIALPHTVPTPNPRFHHTELSVPVFERVLDHLAQLDLDFLLIPGDLTQDGEPENHRWLSARLASLPYPAYVVPGNHDLPLQLGSDRAIDGTEFSHLYAKCGYDTRVQSSDALAKGNPAKIPPLYYTCEVIPGVQLIGLNSVFYDSEGHQTYAGRLDDDQLRWLRAVLRQLRQHSGHASNSLANYVMVMVHHNVIEHLPGQSQSSLGKRYMLENASDLLAVLKEFDVRLIFTGHLHVQDIAQMPVNLVSANATESRNLEDDSRGDRPLSPAPETGYITEITTGSLVSYPHPYRILHGWQDEAGQHLQIETHQVSAIEGCKDLLHQSRERIAERSHPFMMKLLTSPPLNFETAQAEVLAPDLRYFWADICGGDAQFDFPQFPPIAQRHFARFGAREAIDNDATLTLGHLASAP